MGIMSIELKPYSDFESARDLALQLHEAVRSSEAILRQRDLPGPLARYGGELALATANVEKGQHEHLRAELGHYAVIGDSGDVIGSASVYPGLRLRKLRLPIPAGLAQGWLAVEFPYATPNVHAWIKDGEDGLADAYKQLLPLSRADAYHRRIVGTELQNPWHSGAAWTVEPRQSPRWVHRAISSTRLQRVATRRFDEGESRKKVPKRGTLYADLHGTWLTSLGSQQELKTGERSFFDELEYELVSRDPR
jgi:hypothetical protein